MASLDVDFLSTNVPFDEAIEICVNELIKSSQTVSGLNKQQALEILMLTTKENVILFDQKYYSQIDGVTMGSPLGATFNIFLCHHHETAGLKNCPKSFKPAYYGRYVDDIFLLFKKPEQVSRFVNYMNKNTKILSFRLKLKTTPFLFSILRLVQKKINLQQVFSEKIRSVVHTLILAVL